LLNFSRKNSTLHEAQLNFELLKPLGLKKIPLLDELTNYMESFKPPQVDLPIQIETALNLASKVVILHPKSQGSAIEWGIDNYVELAKKLIAQNTTVVFSGTEKEGKMFKDQIPLHPLCIDTTGKLTLEQLIVLISKSNALVACSTGPLHIAGVLGKKAVGLFSPKKPIHPGRWKPLGKNAITLVYDENCKKCSSKINCNCIELILSDDVLRALE
jgi:ADP-heptose:LPS heptosyltransferase